MSTHSSELSESSITSGWACGPSSQEWDQSDPDSLDSQTVPLTTQDCTCISGPPCSYSLVADCKRQERSRSSMHRMELSSGSKDTIWCFHQVFYTIECLLTLLRLIIYSLSSKLRNISLLERRYSLREIFIVRRSRELNIFLTIIIFMKHLRRILTPFLDLDSMENSEILTNNFHFDIHHII